ncbi:MAG: enoyl-ACP reductase FabI [Gammaproteobacteria bacterium]
MARIDMTGKKGLIIGIANEYSLAYGCAKAIHEQGGQLAITYLNDKAKSYVDPLAKELDAELLMPCNVGNDGQVEELFRVITEKWGKLDFLIHSIAFAPREDLHGRLLDSSLNGFLQAMDISCHSLIRMTRKAEPLMQEGGSILTMSYLGADRAIKNYALMGPVKAALESSVRYLAVELGGKNIRVNAISAGPVATRAASGIAEFGDLLKKTQQLSPLKKLLTIDDIGSLATFLASDGSAAITGDTIYVDCGFNIIS